MRTSRSVLAISSTSKKYKSNMLKSVALCVLVWHGMCEFSSRAHPYSSDTQIMNFTASVSPNVNDTDVQIEPKVNYIFDITIFSVNGSLFGTTASPTTSTTASTSASITASPTAFKQGYTVTNGIGAHRLYTTALTWSQAREICIEDGGDLAVIRSDAEDEITKKMVIDSGTIKPWIGFHSQPGKRHWVCTITETGDSGHFLSWMGHNPHTKGADYHVYDHNGTLHNVGCYTTRPFICKIPAI